MSSAGIPIPYDDLTRRLNIESYCEKLISFKGGFSCNPSAANVIKNGFVWQFVILLTENFA